jgi:hypothetical protein
MRFRPAHQSVINRRFNVSGVLTARFEGWRGAR